MKLHNETVSPQLIRCLKTIMQSDIFKDFNLVGGTCLSLQLGHRRSIDSPCEILQWSRYLE